MGAGNNLKTFPREQEMDAQEPRGKRVNQKNRMTCPHLVYK